MGYGVDLFFYFYFQTSKTLYVNKYFTSLSSYRSLTPVNVRPLVLSHFLIKEPDILRGKHDKIGLTPTGVGV